MIKRAFINHCLACLAIVMVLLSDKFSAKASEDITRQNEQDSMLHILSMTEDSNEKIKLLEKLSTSARETPVEPVYLKEIMKLSEQTGSMDNYYQAISNIGRYYGNQNQLDSLIYWVNILDSISATRGEMPEAVFRLHNYLCRTYLTNGEYELSMNEAVRQQLMAEKNNNKMGVVSSYENFGYIYILTGRYHDAISAFEKALSLLKEMKNEEIYEIQIIRTLVRVCYDEGELEKMKIWLDYWKNSLVQNKVKKPEWYPIENESCLLYIQYARLYTAMNKEQDAFEALQKASALMRDSFDAETQEFYLFANGTYYYYIKDYKQALFFANKLLAIASSDNEIIDSSLKLKRDILRALGRSEEAYAISDKLLQSSKEANTTTFSRQVNQLRSLHELNEKERQEQERLFKEQQLSDKQGQLIALAIFSLILLFMIYGLLRYSYRTKKLKDALVKEKVALHETSKNLQKAKEQAEAAQEQAEQANRLKSEFVANISHEIRTPLNAIVGFSSILSDSSDEERKEYIKIINNNTELLLKLINDMLDLSQLESGNFMCSILQTNIQGCCQQSIATMSHLTPEKVQLRFTHPDKPLFADTDPLRLQQLLVNLLTNAAKFTTNGEIILDYKADEEAKQIIFSVTDTGCGIPIDKQEIIFDRFQKLDEFKQGVGLGLSISRLIAISLGGSLFVDPSYTQGARFVFIHPIHKQQIDI